MNVKKLLQVLVLSGSALTATQCGPHLHGDNNQLNNNPTDGGNNPTDGGHPDGGPIQPPDDGGGGGPPGW